MPFAPKRSERCEAEQLRIALVFVFEFVFQVRPALVLLASWGASVGSEALRVNSPPRLTRVLEASHSRLIDRGEAHHVGPSRCIRVPKFESAAQRARFQTATRRAQQRLATSKSDNKRFFIRRSSALTFDMSGGPKGAKRPLERPLDGRVRPAARAGLEMRRRHWLP